ncbi:MAG: hypothetical protein V4549_07545 [Bacteroidota bacterium]
MTTIADNKYILNIKEKGRYLECGNNGIRTYFIENKDKILTLKLCCFECGEKNGWDYHEKVPNVSK